MTTREEHVRVRVKGGGEVNFVAGTRFALKVGAGAIAEKWDDGSPITRAEFDAVLAKEHIFELVEESKSQRVEKSKGEGQRSTFNV